MNKYERLSLIEREEISRGIAEGISFRKIGKVLNRSLSSITREVEKTCDNKMDYRAILGQQRAQEEAKKPRSERKLKKNRRLERTVIKYLKKHWSPEQIENRLKMLYIEDMNMRVSHETIYGYIYMHPREHLKRELYKYLRRKHVSRRKKKTREKSCPIQDYVSIDKRPKWVEEREMAGDWEADLVMGAGNRSAVGTMVERKTRLTLITKLKKKDARSVCNAFSKKLNKLPDTLKKSLTYDQGCEMAEHKLFTQKTNIKVYFAHPHAPWERGTIENTNSLIREFFPAGTDFTTISSAQLKKVENLLNDRPRKVLNWCTPREVFTKSVALGTRM